MANTQEIESLLESGKMPSIRKAVKEIAKQRLESFGAVLQVKLIEMLPNDKSWETQVEIIRALGVTNYKPALRTLAEICQKNKETDMVTYVAGTAYVRLKKDHEHDAGPVFDLINLHGYAVLCGAGDALGYDKMVPSPSDQKKIVDAYINLRSPNPKGLSDPRYGVAAACAGWDPDIVRDFLMSCLTTGDAPVKHVAENSLKKKYVKLR